MNRWKNREPYQIVTECVQSDYSELLHKIQIEESIEDLYETISLQEEPKIEELGALSIEGQKILKLQDLIEEKILLQPIKSNNNLFSYDQIESRFILLRNELIFEKYLQKQVNFNFFPFFLLFLM